MSEQITFNPLARNYWLNDPRVAKLAETSFDKNPLDLTDDELTQICVSLLFSHTEIVGFLEKDVVNPNNTIQALGDVLGKVTNQ